MFSQIKNMWREARSDVVAKEADDVIARFDRLGGYEQYELVSAFDYTKTDLELERGEFVIWQTEDKIAVSKQLMKNARAGFRKSPAGASGVALLSLFLEAQTLPGEIASRLVTRIAEWHRRAVEKHIVDRS